MTSSGTAALEMAMLLLDLSPGDEVIMPSFNYVAAPSAVSLHGGTPVFVDIRADTLNLDEACVREAVTPRTRAIIPVHYAGVGCEMDTLRATARDHDLVLVEDSAHGLFGSWRDQPLGTIGELGILSFHDTKNISCGEGGALLVNEDTMIEAAESLWQKGTNRAAFFRGEVDAYSWTRPSGSYQLAELLAAVLLAQLEHGREIQDTRSRLWRRYEDALGDWAKAQGIRIPTTPEKALSSHHIFWLVFPEEEAQRRFIRHCGDAGIAVPFHYTALHESLCAQQRDLVRHPLPVSEHVSRTIARLPLFDALTESDQDYILDTVRAFNI
jgi:dTDP-4-amino-4,6-dideoxygalactose transaminase